MMKIWTSCYKRVPELKAAGFLDSQLVAISVGVPGWFKSMNSFSYEGLAPSKQLLTEYHGGMDWKEYIKRYRAEVLDKLDPATVYSDLSCSGQDMVLLCHEEPGEHCHRQLVAAWLMNRMGTGIFEWDGESPLKLFRFKDYVGSKDASVIEEYESKMEEDMEEGEHFIREKSRQYRTAGQKKQEDVDRNDREETGLTGSDEIGGMVREEKKSEKIRYLNADYECQSRDFKQFKSERKSLVVAGSRTYKDYKEGFAILDAVVKAKDVKEIISGGATGADQLGIDYAIQRGMYLTVVPAPWKTQPAGRKDAGMRRNRWMADLCDLGVVFNLGTPGSTMMADELSNKGKLVKLVRK